MQVFGVIMAGGGGTRFWPLSRKSTPKQLLNLSGKDVMVNESIARLSQVSARDDLYIVTNCAQVDKMKAVTGERVLAQHILCEPSARNTAACIGYAAVKIASEHGDGIMVITPSDAYIKDEAGFANILRKAIKGAEGSDSLFTIGITPTFAATGYGYIKYADGQEDAKRVISFVEKPDEKTALRYLSEGGYLWNSGMFVWKVSTILNKFKRYLPDIYADLMTIKDSLNTPEEERVLGEIYPNIRSISIDYGIMERADDIRVLPADFGWSDVGSWDMLGAVHSSDELGNVVVGDVICEQTQNCVVYSTDKLVATIGVENLVIVQTADAVLVCPKDRAQDVKRIVEKLKTKGREELL